MKKEQPTPTPNIMFVGKQEIKGEIVKGEPLKFVVTPAETILLPDAEMQLKGFFHEKATDICRLFPHLYKPVTQKGDK
jgi:hypothetical protein